MKLTYSLRLPQNPKSPTELLSWFEKLGLVLNRMYQSVVAAVNDLDDNKPELVIKTDTGNPATTVEGTIQINTFDNKVKIYADSAWRELASW